MKGFFSYPSRKQWIYLGVAVAALLVIILAAAGVGSRRTESQKSAVIVTQDKENATTQEEREEVFSEAQESEGQAQAVPAGEHVTVTRVIDGDTIEVTFPDGRVEKVRYIGMNTPERGQPYFSEATAANSSLVAGKQVRMEKDVSERDRYGRLLRYVYVGDLMVNAELVARGYANAATYPPDVRHSEHFVELEANARNNNLGLWTPPPATTQPPPVATQPPPAITQPAPSEGGSTVYITNTGKKYHSDGCQYLKKSKIPISLADAKARGYDP